MILFFSDMVGPVPAPPIFRVSGPSALIRRVEFNAAANPYR